ncbi:MAG: dTMP kinase [Holosporales bacterium]|jgi:dTMP kinase|nr:dTMP kinase [Holosporales bacterium]
MTNKNKCGLFITFEGGDGSGKSGQSDMLFSRLTDAYPNILITKTREPGGSEGAELIRKMLLVGDPDRWYPVSEMLLFYAARYDNWRRRILPALMQNGIVICDRFFDSSIVYQGFGLGLPEKFFNAIHEMFDLPVASSCQQARSFIPDRTYILDIDPVKGISRSNIRQVDDAEKEDRFEQIDINFHEKIRHGYLKICEQNPERCILIDASMSVEQIHESIWNDIKRYI